MALENQTFKAPAIPKMGRKTVSSSVFSNVLNSAKSSQLKTSKIKFSFLKANSKFDLETLKGVNKKGEILKGVEKKEEGILQSANTLNETNRILVEIQKQLALDFANRIAERKERIAASKKVQRKQKLKEKEDFVEKGKPKLPSVGGKALNKITAPIKSVFDKLLEFFTLVGGGILLNKAWEWLSDKENREKFLNVLKFLGKHWKWIATTVLAIKLLGPITKLLKLLGSIKKLINIFRRKPPGSGGGRRGGGTNNKGPSGGCGPVTGKGGCLDQLSATSSVANRLAQTLFATAFATNYFKKFVPNVEPVKAPAPLQQPAEQEATTEAEQQTQTPTQTPAPTVIPLKSFTGKEIPRELNVAVEALQREYNKTKKDQSLMTEYGFLQIKATARNRIGLLGGPDLTPRIHFNPNLTPKTNAEAIAAAEALFAIANLPATLAPVISARGAVGRSINSSSKRGSLGAYRPPGPIVVQDPGPRITIPPANAIRQAPKRSKGNVEPRVSASDMRRSSVTDMVSGSKRGNVGSSTGSKKSKRADYDEALAKSMRAEARAKRMRAEYDRLLLESRSVKEANEQFLRSFKQSDLDLILQKNKLSDGGTISGLGSPIVDSVPAMLAPGEEVIRTASANMFRPVLKDINDNAGRLYTDFEKGTFLQERQIRLSELNNKSFGESAEKFDEMVEKLLAKQQKRKQQRIIDTVNRGGDIIRVLNRVSGATTLSMNQNNSGIPDGIPDALEPGPNNPIGQIVGGDDYMPMINNKPQQYSDLLTLNVTAPKKEPVKSIETYRVKRTPNSSSGSPTIVNMPLPAQVMPDQGDPGPVMQSDGGEPPVITHMSIDPANPNIREAFEDFGIFA